MSFPSAPHIDDVTREVKFVTSRSSGPGGQNVNKVNSKVILQWDVRNSAVLNEDQRSLILSKAGNKLTQEQVLILQVQSSRSQRKNKEEALGKLNELLRKIFTPRKKRKNTKPTKASVQKRVGDKKKRSEKKQWRQKPDR